MRALRLLPLVTVSLMTIGAVVWDSAPPADASPTRQPPDQEKIRVATKAIEPFVFLDDARPTGFSIDLWEEITLLTGIPFEWVIVDSVGAQLDAVESGEADAAIAAISMTPEREDRFDFSYPYYRSGLQIMTMSRPIGTLTQLFSVLVSPRLLIVYAFMLVILVVVGHIVWLVERERNDHFPRGYKSGIWEGLWWAAVTVTTVGYGDRTVKGVGGRILGLVWMFFGILLLANFTAVVTSELTVARIDNTITSVQDLHGKEVGTVAGTTSAAHLHELGVDFHGVDNIEEAIERLRDDEFDAIVYDVPILQYRAAEVGDPRLQLVGAPLTREEYAIALPQPSPYEEQINAAMLKLYENGTYDELLEKWSQSDP